MTVPCGEHVPIKAQESNYAAVTTDYFRPKHASEPLTSSGLIPRIPALFTNISELIRFLLFLVFSHRLVVGSVR